MAGDAGLEPAAREVLLRDYRRLYAAAKDAYLAVSREVGGFYTQARACRAKCIVEFGTSFGLLSTVYHWPRLRDNGGGRLISSEMDADKAYAGRGEPAKAGLADLVENPRRRCAGIAARMPSAVWTFVPGWGQRSIARVLGLCESVLRPVPW